MGLLRTPLRAAALALTALACTAPPSMAIVGGSDAAPGAYPAVAEITFGKGVLCTGALIAPDAVLTAGHCLSITGAAVASPAAFPPQLIDVRIANATRGTGGEVVGVRSVSMNPDYLLTQGYDISILKLSRASTKTPVQVAGAGETALWSPGTLESIVGWGATSQGGSTPDTLHQAQVPVVGHPECIAAYGGDIDEATMLCAVFPWGGVDTCRGNSGGPMFGRTGPGVLRVVGATSFGTGCARPGIPGVDARVGDTELRDWIRGQAPQGVAAG